MWSDALLFFVLSFFVYFIGHYGYSADKWGFGIYVFVFTLFAGLLFGIGIMQILYPSLPVIQQIGIVLTVTLISFISSLVVLKMATRRRK